MSNSRKKGFANHELVTLALFLLRGDSKAVDLEEIAMKVNSIAPGRFTWRKYPKQINIKNVDAFLWDAKKPKNGSFVLNVRKDEWVLTEKGLSFARQKVTELRATDVARKPMSSKEQKWIRRERERMLCSDAFQKFAAGNFEKISRQEAEAFFRVDAYVTGKTREEKIIRTKNVFGDDPNIGPLIGILEAKLAIGGQA
jgi:hypothetical protein